jgi:cytochrome c
MAPGGADFFTNSKGTTMQQPRKLVRRLAAGVLAATLPIAAVAMTSNGSASADKPSSYSILLFTRAAGFAHPSIPSAIEAIDELGAQRGFTVVQTTDPNMFNDAELSKYAAVVFVNTTGNVLPATAQRQALEGYIQSGGGYLGVHAASDMGGTVRNGWPWYRDLVGAAFKGHTATYVWSDNDPNAGGIYAGPLADAPDDADYFGTTLRYRSWEPALVDVEDVNSPAMRGWGQSRTFVDEWYGFLTNPRDHAHVLASLDEGSYSPAAGDMGPGDADHPIAWCRTFDGGRSVYTGMGHTIAAWSDHLFLKHITGAIEMAAGAAAFDCEV